MGRELCGGFRGGAEELLIGSTWLSCSYLFWPQWEERVDPLKIIRKSIRKLFKNGFSNGFYRAAGTSCGVILE